MLGDGVLLFGCDLEVIYAITSPDMAWSAFLVILAARRTCCYRHKLVSKSCATDSTLLACDVLACTSPLESA